MNDNEQIEKIIHSHGISDYKWLDPRNDIVVAHWVRFRCRFGCNEYGKTGSCPPAVPPVDECRKMILEYEKAIILHFQTQSPTSSDKIKQMTDLLEIEREVFLSGHYKAFLLQYADCCFCKACAAEGSREKCLNKAKCRPSVDAMGIDMFQTARNAGYSIQVLKDRDDMQNRFALLLVG